MTPLTQTQLTALRQIAAGNYTGHSPATIKALLRRRLIVQHDGMHMVGDCAYKYRYEATKEGEQLDLTKLGK